MVDRPAIAGIRQPGSAAKRNDHRESWFGHFNVPTGLRTDPPDQRSISSRRRSAIARINAISRSARRCVIRRWRSSADRHVPMKADLGLGEGGEIIERRCE